MARSRFSSLLTCVLIILFGAGLILCTKDVSAAAADAIGLCARTVIPALFPFFVLSSLCISTGIGTKLARLAARPIERLFRLPAGCAPALVLGWIGGYPTGARTAFDLYDCGVCTAEECSRLLPLCSCCGPAFLISAAGAVIFDSLPAGFVLYGCHLASAALLGWIAAHRAPLPRKNTLYTAPAVTGWAAAFTRAVTGSFGAILDVCGFVIFFAALLAFLESSGLMGGLQDLLFFLPAEVSDPLLRGLTEMTGGITALRGCALPLPQAMALAALTAGWGGLSVHAQILSLLGDRPIAMGKYLRGKLLHGLLAAVLTYVAALRLFSESTAAYAPQPLPPGYTVTNPFYFILVCGVYLAACLLVTGIVLWLEGRAEPKDGCQDPKKQV